jgi:hypothetical protein
MSDVEKMKTQLSNVIEGKESFLRSLAILEQGVKTEFWQEVQKIFNNIEVQALNDMRDEEMTPVELKYSQKRYNAIRRWNTEINRIINQGDTERKNIVTLKKELEDLKQGKIPHGDRASKIPHNMNMR